MLFTSPTLPAGAAYQGRLTWAYPRTMTRSGCTGFRIAEHARIYAHVAARPLAENTVTLERPVRGVWAAPCVELGAGVNTWSSAGTPDPPSATDPSAIMGPPHEAVLRGANRGGVHIGPSVVGILDQIGLNSRGGLPRRCHGTVDIALGNRGRRGLWTARFIDVGMEDTLKTLCA